VLWIYLGLSGALFSAVRAHDSSFRVGFGWKDLAIVAAADVAIIATVYLYAKWALR
jgi:hypothetical protein